MQDNMYKEIENNLKAIKIELESQIQLNKQNNVSSKEQIENLRKERNRLRRKLYYARNAKEINNRRAAKNITTVIRERRNAHMRKNRFNKLVEEIKQYPDLLEYINEDTAG